MNSHKPVYSLAELAQALGMPGRTIRYYIARGLLAGPLKAGRDAAYSEEHLLRLRQIMEMQEQGKTLMEIARLSGGQPEAVKIAQPVPWWQYQLAGDVVVSVRGDTSPWRMRQINQAIAQMAATLGDVDRNEKGKESNV